MVTNSLSSVIDGLKQEEARLEQIAARFEKSHSVHHDSVLKLINSIKRHIAMLESGRESNAA